MNRNLKTLLLAVTAVLALGAVVASSASAHAVAKSYTNISEGNTVVTTKADGTGTTAHQVFDTPGNGAITCNDVELEGTVNGLEPTEIVLKEKGSGFTGCTFLGQSATVKLEGCSFTFTPAGSVSTVCPEGKLITFGITGCTVTVKGGQTFANAVKYANGTATGSEMEVTAEVATGEEIHTVATGPNCLFMGTSAKGRYTTGNTLLFGETDPGTTRKGITVDF